MAKTAKTVFFCQNCGYESSKWMGQCPACKGWNTFVEEKIAPSSPQATPRRGRAERAKPARIRDISLDEEVRILSGIGELDRVLGGGLVKASLVLIGGDPGIGKSTILLQACRRYADQGRKILYISGEESLQQIRIRAERISKGASPDGEALKPRGAATGSPDQRSGADSDSLFLLAETNLGDIRETITEEMPDVCVIDSIQTMYSEEISSAPGSVSQVREATGVLMMLAKTLGISIFIVGHVTKDGSVAGPRVLEHMVDTVLYFEGDRHASYRILRAVKNRFGSTNEIGVFEMRDKGLVEVPNPSEYMLSGKPKDASGSIVACSMEGTRPILIEIQALVSHSSFQLPRRTAVGTDYNRVNLLLAVLERRCGLSMGNCDAYVNIAGGIKMTEPAVDLGIVLALVSGYTDRPIGDSIVAFGEVGLSGEVRAVSQAEQRVKEARKLGFKTVILPKANFKAVQKIDGIEILPVSSLREAIHVSRLGA